MLPLSRPPCCCHQAARMAGGYLGLTKNASLRRMVRLKDPSMALLRLHGMSTSPSTTMRLSHSMPEAEATTGVFPGGVEIPFTSHLNIVDPSHLPVSCTTLPTSKRRRWPVHRPRYSSAWYVMTREQLLFLLWSKPCFVQKGHLT